MSFAQENGYTPRSFNELMDLLRQGVNTQFGTSYTTESFVGTNLYKYFYQLVQMAQENEVKTAEIFQKLQQYIALTNEAIQRPSVSNPGLLEAFASEDYVVSVRPATEATRGIIAICVDIAETVTGARARGEIEVTSYDALVDGSADDIDVGSTTFVAQAGAATPGDATFQAASSNAATAASLAAQINAHATAKTEVRARAVGNFVYLEAVQPGTAGNSLALVYTDNNPSSAGIAVSDATLEGGTAASAQWPDVKLEIATLIKNFVVAGLVSEGAQSQNITLSNGQEFAFKFGLPTRIPILLRLTASESENSAVTTPSDEAIRSEIFAQINARYRLGWNFEPQRYFNLEDAQWAQELVLEYSFDDGDTWTDNVYDAAFDEILTFGLEDIEVDIT